jgi:hypothetical protein
MSVAVGPGWTLLTVMARGASAESESWKLREGHFVPHPTTISANVNENGGVKKAYYFDPLCQRQRIFQALKNR